VFNPWSQNMPKRTDIHSVLIIGRACAFDYPGAQTRKAGASHKGEPGGDQGFKTTR
jgi:hypothetical protein